jgi:hypothetical protein
MEGGVYTCCGGRYKRRRTSVYREYGFEMPHQGYYKEINGENIYIPVPTPPPGCTSCDHGNDLKQIVLNDFMDVADYLDRDSLHADALIDEGDRFVIRRSERFRRE